MFAADAATFLADFGGPLSWAPSTGGATQQGLAIFDQADAGEDGGNHISREYTLTLETAAWAGLKRGELVVVGVAGDAQGNGATYKLRTDLVQALDGVFSTVKLSKVAP